ncbi:pyocin knob domain-containing S74 family peptidase [Leclercia adecarboxylata]|uniref:pyocin knob domain-containing S74 family peptidase n=1 Tax=Leclercia adecarboxylata TaxID=83655 RepID=UPI0021F0DC73|nr:pyocin knob domain-containing S74 family peptidase [Leclercia adecarboxylata]UYM56783.1 pyocin knob domain-containing S74 family peptidase [Leclercia adecarboxylata]
MAGIMLGNRTLLSYSSDVNNSQPTAQFINIDNLAAFPEVKINSTNQTIETYDQEYTSMISGGLKINNISIVVHYEPTNIGHMFLSNAYSTNRVFQLKFSLYESATSFRQHYIILNGRITAWKDDADVNKVYGRTWTFTPDTIVRQGSIDEPPVLYTGNFGVGSDGTTVPHYESDAGNAFIKVSATRTDNPIGVDLLGVGLVDGGGISKAQIVLSESSTPRMYIKNTDSNAWDQVYSTANKPVLNAGTTQGITGILPIANGGTGSSVAATALSNLGGLAKTGGTLTGAVTGTALTLSSTLSVTGVATVNNTINQDSVAAATYGHTSLSAAAAGTKSYLRKMRGGTGDTIFHETVQSGNYRLATGASTDSSDALTLSSTGNLTITGALTATGATFSTALPISSGGTGANTAAAALTNLGAVPNTTKVNNKLLNGDVTLTPADIGTVPVLNGGTGATTAAAALTNLGAVPASRTINGKPLSSNVVLSNTDISGSASAGANSDITSLTGLTTALSIAQGGTGSTTAAGARTSLGLGTVSTFNIGTSGASVPVLNASNTWSGTQNLDGLIVGAARTGSVGIELGSLTTAGSAFLDFHSSGFNNDYDTRIISSGGVEGSSNQGTLTFSASKLQFNGTPSFNTAIPVTSGGTGSTTAAGALTSLGAVSTAIKVNGYSLTSDVTLRADDVSALPSRGLIPVGTDLNDLDGTVQGYYQQTLNSNATAILNYPAQYAGTLVVLQNSATHVKSCTQMYYRYNTNDLYTRTGYSNSSGVIAWGAWGMYAYTDINGVNSSIKSLTGLTTAIPITGGGTGATTAAAALTNLGGVPVNRTINGKPLTGNVVLSNTDVSGSASSGANSDITSLSGLTTALSVAQGGTGSTSASAALSTLGGMPKTGGTFSGAVTVSSNLAVTGTLSTSNSLIQDGVVQTTYCQTALSSGTSGNKSYLRKFRGGTGDTIWHETVQGQTYRIATGSTDTVEALTLSNLGDLTTSNNIAKNNDATYPTGVATLYGGQLKSQYTVNNVEKASSYSQIVKRSDWNYSINRLYVSQTAGGNDTAQNRYFDFTSEGNFNFSGKVSTGSPSPSNWLSASIQNNAGVYMAYTQDDGGVNAIGALSWGYQHSQGYNLRSMWGNVGNGTSAWANTSLTQFGDSGSAGNRYWYFIPQSGDLQTTGSGAFGSSYTFQKAATSDATLKHDINYDDGKASYDNIKKLKPCTFVYNFDELNRKRRGIIAQDALRDIDSEYVKLVPAAPEYDDEGNRCDKDDTLALDNNVIMMDTAIALKVAIEKIEAMQQQFEVLQTELAELKALNK